jgi:hypothetical protein
MNKAPPINESLTEPTGIPSRNWLAWLLEVFACLPWKKASNTTATLNFPSIAAQSEQGLTVTIKGCRSGDAVIVTPASNVAGVFFRGVVTADNVVTVYAKNFTGASIDPPSILYRIIVLQN